MSKSFKIDLTGQRFGRLTVIKFIPNEKNGSYWLCRCKCGNEAIINSGLLKLGHTKSCGCLSREKSKTRIIRQSITHNSSRSRLYRIWKNMKQRCYNPNHNHYKDYGGRNILICDEWKNDFVAFRDWSMENGYADNLSIDRIDNDGNYTPNNCRWVDKKTQQRNRKNNVYVEFKGEKKTLSEVAELLGMDKGCLWHRYKAGDRGEKLFCPKER